MMRTVVFSPIFRSDFCSKENCNSLPFTFGYRTSDLSLRYLSFERVRRRISCSVW